MIATIACASIAVHRGVPGQARKELLKRCAHFDMGQVDSTAWSCGFVGVRLSGPRVQVLQVPTITCCEFAVYERFIAWSQVNMRQSLDGVVRSLGALFGVARGFGASKARGDTTIVSIASLWHRYGIDG